MNLNRPWSIPSGNQDSETVHGTQKPVECMRRPMLNNSSPGQVVYEPFLGLGTTLIAAETTGRICYGMELDPAYVDVAVKRLQAFTGKDAVLVGSDQTFQQVQGDREREVTAWPGSHHAFRQKPGSAASRWRCLSEP